MVKKESGSKTDFDRFRVVLTVILKGLKSSDSFEVQKSRVEYENLVDEFESEYGEYIAPQQIEALRRDPEFFLQLIDWFKQF